MTYNWEAEILRIIEDIMPSSDMTHNATHVRAVAKRARRIRLEPEFRHKHTIDDEILIAGAYLHDVGYCEPARMISVDSFEHIDVGVRKSLGILTRIRFPNPKIPGVLYLIKNHDNAKWSIPNWNLPGRMARLSPEQIREWEWSDDIGLKDALKIVKEADSAEFTDKGGTLRTWYYGEMKNIPIKPYPSHTHILNEDRLSNLLIFPHLAWLSASTQKGKQVASLGYLRAESWVYNYCQEHSIPYVPNPEVEEIQWAFSNMEDRIPPHLKP